MAETPKTREELEDRLWQWCKENDEPLTPDVAIKAIESLGLHIVPKTLTPEMRRALSGARNTVTGYTDNGADEFEATDDEIYGATIAASPFAPENPNG